MASSVDFKDTLNLPKTDFPIRANHAQEDEILLERWEQEKLFEKSFYHNEGKETFILHDGPPYANGHIHLGSAYNKILKDIVGKTRRMAGYHVPITPGWDCHGLPIELKVLKEHPGLQGPALQKQCRVYAAGWIDIQRQEFKKLGVLMNWDKPYITMAPSYEATTIRALARLIAQGYIEKKKKTVPWCFQDQTVLAHAEIEYKERKDPSLYVLFRLEDQAVSTLFSHVKNVPVYVVVWTTTPWTLPLNRAVLLHPQASYELVKLGDRYCLIGKGLATSVAQLAQLSVESLDSVEGKQLQGYTAWHPFLDQKVPLILDISVGMQEGTAAVHCAPGCGPQDYEVGVRNNLEIYSPIAPDGTYTSHIQPQELRGMSVVDGQIWVIKKLHELGTLLAKTTIKHSYPHCWRCHQGLIFRATNQWFCNLEHNNLKKEALQALEHIQFLPKRSSNFLKAGLEGRLEWCLSRQRTWGVPIPALVCPDCDYSFTDQALLEKVAHGVEQEGIEFWTSSTLESLGYAHITCPTCHKKLVKEGDILDVWFDSGVSHYAVLHTPPQQYPACVYVEGLDQHRGWFQSSLLTSMILEKKPCTQAFLTHGFVVDQHGHKMSKSLGNVVTPAQMIAELGTDGLRLWAASVDYSGDPSVSKTLLQNVTHVYRKIRNTCRFLLSNLYDFDSTADAVAYEKLGVFDRYALQQLYIVQNEVLSAYAQYDFTGFFHLMGDYCANDLSALYLDSIKDRLYVDAPNGHSRKSAQTVSWYILDTITKLMAPVLSYTAEQVSDYYQKEKKQSIHLQLYNDLEAVKSLFSRYVTSGDTPEALYSPKTLIARNLKPLASMPAVDRWCYLWAQLLDMRSALLKVIESQREAQVIKHSLEVHISVYLDAELTQLRWWQQFIKDLKDSGQTLEQFLKDFLIVSQVQVRTNSSGLEQTPMKGLFAQAVHATGNKCPRCWHWDTTEHVHHLCTRCMQIVKD